ncbi:hypothetical protein LSUB1_G004098 [Lachnellula subtilissima]|uniref:SAM domain-containing protein n=1 Tax=Lachnellula subtilissima TaxID=602034 RepID=A0A8H8UBX7_9HELO|nr:hypothetical protein LSUB1_G004098 [Lachnellula subtilissima]
MPNLKLELATIVAYPVSRSIQFWNANTFTTLPSHPSFDYRNESSSPAAACRYAIRELAEIAGIIDALRNRHTTSAFDSISGRETNCLQAGDFLFTLIGNIHKRARGSLKATSTHLDSTFSSPGRSPDATYCMTELGDIFAELGISHYLEDFIDQGFDTWDTILDITESDFDALGVKLGHRRKLQRKIANSRGLSSDRALASPRHTPSEDRQPEEQKAGATKADAREGGAAHGAKRKYRRHPKPDDNAPERPPSADSEACGRKLAEYFTRRKKSHMSNKRPRRKKDTTTNWQNTKKTSSYKDYSQYLVEFKARQSNQQQVTDLEIAKRPKLEPHASNGSSGTASSGASQHGGDIPIVRARVGSTASSNGPWLAEGYSPAGVSKLNVAAGPSNSQSSPNTSSPSFLPGYRESIYGGTQQSLPWRDVHREDNPAPHKLPHLASISDRRPSPPSLHNSDSPILTGSVQHHPHRTAPTQSHPPPLLSSESTNRSASSASTSSYFSPHTPMEPPPERALPIPSLYPQKPYETQLPTLRPPSLSPQSASLSSQQSPIAISSFFEHPSSMAPMRGFTATSPQNIGHAERPDTNTRDFISQSTNDDNNLDPVSALLKAGEIVNRNSRAELLDYGANGKDLAPGVRLVGVYWLHYDKIPPGVISASNWHVLY